MHSAKHNLEITDLHVYHGRAHILQGVTLEVSGEPVALLGRNGMGKTTLCQALMGLVPSASGDIRFGGVSLVGRAPHDIAKLGIGYVPQGRRIFPSLSVDEHLRLMQRAGIGRAGGWTPARVYEVFPRLAERKASGAASLSGGEQQMLAIARVLRSGARLILLDEPTEGLAPVIVDAIAELLLEIKRAGITVLLVEQNVRFATRVSDRHYLMVNGQIIESLRNEDVRERESALLAHLGV